MARSTRIWTLLGAVATFALAGLVLAWHWWTAPLPIADAVTVEIARGSAPVQVAARLADAGVLSQPRWFVRAARLLGQDGQLKAGEYAILPGTSPRSLLQQLVEGRVVQHAVTFIEGHTSAEAWARLRADPAIAATPGLTLDGLMARLGEAGTPAEGAFFPDTYAFARGTSDVEVMRQARRRMVAALEAAWQDRAAGLPLKSAQEALVLASLVEKETGAPEERPLIAGVFINRLRSGMRLQTDPSVIYGLGDKFDGNLRKADLLRDGPYNTYRRAGLPPTPIALPGAAALRAAVRPAETDAIFFVATGRGDGRHVFSTTLAEHNAAVRAYLARTSGGN